MIWSDLLTIGTPDEIRTGSHLCWVVRDVEGYESSAAAILEKGREANEKIFAFGPSGSRALGALAALGATVADPLEAFLDGQFVPAKLFEMFRTQMQQARAEGYSGLRLVADMEWLHAAGPSTADVVSFELMLDRVLRELGATVVCAYHAHSFGDDAIHGVAAVHPVTTGAQPAFRLFAEAPDGWVLSGEVDLSVAAAFETAISTAAAAGSAEIDVGDLRFIDGAGVRRLAEAAAAHGLQLRRASRLLRRLWRLGGYETSSFADQLPA